MKWAASLALAAASLSLASVQASCPPYFVDLGDGTEEVCIFFNRAKDTWEGHRANCDLLGSDLAKLTGNLHTKVIEYIKDQPDDDLNDENFWIGGSGPGKDGPWTWIHDYSEIPLGTPHWYPCNRHMEPYGDGQNNLCLPTPKFYFHSCDGAKEYMGICQFF